MANRKRRKTLKDYSRENPLGRQEIIDRCRVPTEYTLASKQKKRVSSSTVKAVLRCIATWDQMGAKFYKGIDNIAWRTCLSSRAVNHAFCVLEQAGIMTSKFQGLSKPKVRILDWDRIKSLCQEPPEQPGDTEPDNGEEPVGDQEPPIEELEQPLGPVDDDDPVAALADKVIAKFARFNPEPDQLPQRAVERMLRSLAESHKLGAIGIAADSLTLSQLGACFGAKNQIGYLRIVLSNAIQGLPVPDDDDHDQGLADDDEDDQE